MFRKKKDKENFHLKPGEIAISGKITQETAKEFVNTLQNPKVYRHVHKNSFQHALDTIESALQCGQLGLTAHSQLKLVFVYEREDPNNGYRDPYSYSIIRKVSDITFKSKEELDAEDMKRLSDKINKLKEEIDNKSKELAELAQKARG